VKRLLAIFAILVPVMVFSQPSNRHFPDLITKEKLIHAKLISDISPGYWDTDEYNKNMEYLSTEIKTQKMEEIVIKGHLTHRSRWWWRHGSADGKGPELSKHEKKILAKAKAGDWIYMVIKFKHKDAKYNGPEDEHKLFP
jgi:hypothetical protein